MANIIATAVILVIVALAAGYVYKAKKNGRKCIGCPGSGCCGKDGESSCGGGCSGCGR